MSKGTQMRKFSTFKEAAQKIVIKKPWGVEVKSYKAGDPIPAGVEFKIFNANDTAKIDAYADGLDESADYQKKRFKEPAYMYEGFMVKEKSGNTYIGRFDSKDKAEKAVKDLAKKYGKSEGNWLVEPDDKYMAAATSKGASSWGPIPMNTLTESIHLSNEDDLYYWMLDYMKKNSKKGSTSLQFITDNGNSIIISWDMKAYNGIGIDGKKMNMSEFCHHRMKGVGIQDVWEVDMNTGRFKPIKEGFLITGPSIEGKTFYVRSKDGQGTTFDRSNAFIFNSEKEAKDTIEKMKKAGYYTDKIEVIKESQKAIKEAYLLVDTDTNNKPVYFHWGKYTGIDWWDDKKMASRFSTKEQAERWIEKMRQEGAIIKDMKIVQESRIAKGYENLNADEKARHLLSHPTSKYMSDLKSENITERAIRKAVKEMLGKPDKRDPQFIIDVNEGCIKESVFYVKFSQDGKSSKYYIYNNGKHGFTDDKSKATKFSSKEEAEKAFKKNPYYDAFNMKYFDIVSEEGEAPAIANTTAEVANPELPLKLKEATKVPYLLKNAKVGDTFHDGSDLGREYKITRVTPSKVYATCVKDPNTTGEYNRSHSDFNETDPQWAKLYTIKY